MKKYYAFTAFLAIVFLSSCSSVSVTDSWKDDNMSNIKNEQILVIGRTDDGVTRQRFEQEIANELRAQGYKATESYTKFPSTLHNVKRTDAEIDQIISMFKAEGFNAVCLTVLRDMNQEIVSSQTGGYTTGGYYPSYYGGYYGGFGGYYGSVYSPYGYGYGGTYVPAETRTYTSKTYKLETTFYDLNKEPGKQLVGVVSVDVTDPSTVQKVAPQYAAAVGKKIK